MLPRLSRSACKTAIIIGVSFAAGVAVMAIGGHLSAGTGKQAAASEAAGAPNAIASQTPPQSIECGDQRIPAPPQPQMAGGASWASSNGAANGPGMSIPGRSLDYGQTASGYPISTGRRAVDYFDSASGQVINTGVGTDPSATAGWAQDNYSVPEQRIGRNGLVSNPCVDPPSSHGLAYSRSY